MRFSVWNASRYFMATVRPGSSSLKLSSSVGRRARLRGRVCAKDESCPQTGVAGTLLRDFPPERGDFWRSFQGLNFQCFISQPSKCLA